MPKGSNQSLNVVQLGLAVGAVMLVTMVVLLVSQKRARNNNNNNNSTYGNKLFSVLAELYPGCDASTPRGQILCLVLTTLHGVLVGLVAAVVYNCCRN